MTTLDTVKTAKRIGHTNLDDEIKRLIKTAEAELIRLGVSEAKVNDGGSLITEATVTFCLMKLEDDLKIRAEYSEAFKIQADQIRRSSDVR